MSRFFRALSVALLTLSLGVIAISPIAGASAHERRQVGDLWMVVGWKAEPALLDEPNALDLRVYRLKEGTDPAAQTAADRIPVLGLDKTLKATVTYGDKQKRDLTLAPRFNDPGAYDGLVFPNAVGDYTFEISGTVEGVTVSQKFTSADGKFGKIEDTKALLYPNSAVTTGELLAKIEDLEKQITDLEGDHSAPAASAETEEDDDSSSNTLPIIALVLGLAGLGVGGAAFLKK